MPSPQELYRTERCRHLNLLTQSPAWLEAVAEYAEWELTHFTGNKRAQVMAEARKRGGDRAKASAPSRRRNPYCVNHPEKPNYSKGLCRSCYRKAAAPRPRKTNRHARRQRAAA